MGSGRQTTDGQLTTVDQSKKTDADNAILLSLEGPVAVTRDPQTSLLLSMWLPEIKHSHYFGQQTRAERTIVFTLAFD